MPPERWQQVERLHHAALERVPAQRGAFLAEACNSDSELRREVESLLQQETSSSGTPMDRPVLEGAAGLRDSPTVRQLAPGAQLGPYKIEAPLGAGGMGEVFRAVDTRLRRTVALKVLPRERMADPEHRRRFLQEARAASALKNLPALHVNAHMPVEHDVVALSTAGHLFPHVPQLLVLVSGSTQSFPQRSGAFGWHRSSRHQASEHHDHAG